MITDAVRHKPKYPGSLQAVDGNTAVILCEREASDAAGAYPITPSTQMGEYWAEAAAQGHLNISGRPLIFIEPEGEHAAAAVTAGLAMTGLRSANFSSGQGIAYMHESLYAAVGKRLTYVLNIGARAMTKATLNVHAGHDDYHCIDDTGFFQLFARDAQAVADLNLIAHRIAELALNPGAVAQDGFLTTHLIESILVPERELVAEFLGLPSDIIDTPTPAQQIIYGPRRRRIPELWDVDNSLMMGVVQNQDAYMQSVAAQRPFFFDHIQPLTEQAFREYGELTGRGYGRVMGYRTEDADYLLIGQGSVISTAEAVADYLRATRGLKVGVVNVVMWRPFPADLITRLLKGKAGATVLERLDQPLAAELPLMREIRAAVSRALENGRDAGEPPFPELEVYDSVEAAPALYSASFGMGSRDLQPEGLIGAVENMLPSGARKKFFYLSIDFLRSDPVTPKQRIYQERIELAYPNLRQLEVRGSENPDLMPPGSISLRMHSVGGWGAITTGKNLAMTLHQLLGYHIKANPKYGSEKKGQPTTYYLTAAPEPIRVNCETIFVDTVLSPDPNVFQHTNALAGLREEGCLIIQSDADGPEAVWGAIPEPYRRIIRDRRIRVYYLDAFAIARGEASDPDLRLRMQGIAFQGAFFAVTDVARRAGLGEGELLKAIRHQLEHKFGSKGARVVEENIRVVQRGYDLVREVPHGAIEQPEAVASPSVSSEPPLPQLLRHLPVSQSAISDVHRFWEQTGTFYARGMGSDNLTDPFIGLGVIPAATAVFRDMTGIRFQYPSWVSDNCTACGNCYTACPDTAIAGLVTPLSGVLDSLLDRLRERGSAGRNLPKTVRRLEPLWRGRLCDSAEAELSPVQALEGAIDDLMRDPQLDAAERPALQQDLRALREELGDFEFNRSRSYFTLPEQRRAGSGGLLSITVNPQTCKGCMECVEVCDDDALRVETQTPQAVKELRRRWNLWESLPNTPPEYIRVDDLEQAIGALHTILLDKRNFGALTSGDGACLGCGEKTVVHLFTATVEALMQPRVDRHVAELTELIERLERHIQLKLVHEIDVGDPASIAAAIAQAGQGDVTLSGLAAAREQAGAGEPIDRRWLTRVSRLLVQLKQLKGAYVEGTTGRGRAKMGMLNATGCSSVWGSTYPYNPYPFPWANHLFQDAASLAMGVFEGHMAKMAEGFKAIRLAQLELAGEYRSAEHDSFFTYFGWQDFSDREWDLCPPVVAVGGDGAMYDIGFQNLSRALMSGKPIKVLVLDTQVYSNTGGQACTAGFLGQISDMAQFGARQQGKQEIRKEIGLIGLAHRSAYVMQGTIAHANHMIEGFIQGLKARRPALFNLYSACQPEHGIGDDKSTHQAKLVVESRAYPLLRYDPDLGPELAKSVSLEGNPAPDQDWPVYELRYQEGGRIKSLQLPMTFADFAMTENRFRKHFRLAPPETWNDSMVPLHEFLDLSEAEQHDRFPYIWSVDRQQRLSRLLVARPMVEATLERRSFWRMLRSMVVQKSSGEGADQLEARIKQRIAARLSELVAGWVHQASSGEADDGLTSGPLSGAGGLPAAAAGDAAPGGSRAAGETAEVLPWIDSAECTACDECIKINPNIFAYGPDRKAYIRDPHGGPYQDLVKAAERCTAQVIHPGLPADSSTPGLDRWIARGQKYN
jgi:pyruvate-ferredoxin/flavodoxin oxidoreductase